MEDLLKKLTRVDSRKIIKEVRQVQGVGKEGKERVFQSQETASTTAQRQVEIE